MRLKEADLPTPPVLRLRPTVPTECIRPLQRVKQPDGPCITHPCLIEETITGYNIFDGYTDDILLREYRDLWAVERTRRDEEWKGVEFDDFKILSVVQVAGSVDMQSMLRLPDHQIALQIEKLYVGANIYLQPRIPVPPSMVDRFRAEWYLNAHGIYYRHYYSPGWVTADRRLWLPSLEGRDWDHATERNRRERARGFLARVLDNEKWNKSEYAWDADAWSGVFGMMRNDPKMAVDKHKYNTVKPKNHPVSCLLTNESEFVKRIPDATFGLATSRSQNAKDYEPVLRASQLEALRLHRHCGLLCDPSWDETNMAYPFAVYEAKGWSGDPRKARHQACFAGKVYLDMLDRLARKPGKVGDIHGTYQTEQSQNNQVFAFTSFGAHWHVLVGYKRPRLRREHANCDGMSKSAYILQRIWSGRATTERCAWELLSLVDQIHHWGVTDFRDYVIRHLEPWLEFKESCFKSDVDYILLQQERGLKGIAFVEEGGQTFFKAPTCCLTLPIWAEHFPPNKQVEYMNRATYHLAKAYRKSRDELESRSKGPRMQACALGSCGSPDSQGYPLNSIEDTMLHLSQVHGQDDEEIAQLLHYWETQVFIHSSGQATDGIGEDKLQMPRALKRPREDLESGHSGDGKNHPGDCGGMSKRRK